MSPLQLQPAISPIWFEVIDPNTGQHYYANPNTGECLWDSKPATTSIKFADPNGDWWELWDGKNQLPYYYHSRTKETRWTRPDNKSAVISLIKVQEESSTASNRLSVMEPPQVETATRRNSRSLDLLTAKRPVPQRSTSDIGGTRAKAGDDDASRPSCSPVMTKSTTTSTVNLPSFSTIAADTSAIRQPVIRKTHFSRSRASIETAFASFTRAHRAEKKNQVSVPINANPEARTAMHPLAAVPVPDVLTQMDNKSVANDDNKRMMLPSSLQQDINQFAIDGFAQKYFATHKRGLFRRRVPMKEMLEWTKDSLNKPLITLNRDLNKDAQKCFKMIQTIMGDRPRPRMSSDIEDIQAILNCGISKGQMRDEIYVQLCKQLHHNPRGESVRKGWEILCIVCITFPPSKNLESYLNSFVQHHHQIKENDVDVMSQHVSAKLKRICVRGAKGKVLTAAEIERAKEAPFKPSVFGESLEFIMNLESKQEENSVDQRPILIPRIVKFLADAVIRTNGQRSEGIFRVPGDADAITDLRVRIENGNYDASGITDPNVPASLLKYWIRDLPEPLICAEYYDSCVACNDDADKAIGIVNSLPDTNRRIVLYMLAFLQEFIDTEVIKHTLMSVSNLAMVFAPNLLRCPSEALTTVLKNSKFEQGFLRTLLLELEADKNACVYDAKSDRVAGKRKRIHGTSS